MLADRSQTDWDKVARVANFKTPKYARDQWTIVKYKLTGTIITKERKSNVTPSRKRKEREGRHSSLRQYLTSTNVPDR